MCATETRLAEAIAYLRDEVTPRAQAIDGEPEALRTALGGLAQRDLLALKRPPEYGGPAFDAESFATFQLEVARASGALAFLQTQHQSAVAMLSRSDNEDLKHAYLPAMGNGERTVGIGFSQLRRPGPPSLRAERVDGGYRFDGHVPWVTGAGFFGEFLAGAQLPDGRAVFAVLPLRTEAGITVSTPMRLAAMESANTVTLDLEKRFVPESQVAFLRPAGWIRENDQVNVALQGHFALGCAQRGIDLVREMERRDPDSIRAAADALQAELDACRRETLDYRENFELTTTEARLRVRAWAIELAVRCAHAAIVASAGAANSREHPAQRVYREALVFSVSAQTTAIMSATLARLTRP